jgi:GNAT superfamily N-acetyltransferase
MIQLRPAHRSDAGFMIRLEAMVMAAHARALWGRLHPAPDPTCSDLENSRIVERNGAPVGYLTLERTPDHLRLRKLYLAPGHQGHGLGKQLLHIARAEAAAAGLPLRLSVLRPNTRALNFYLREGLEPVEATAERIFLQSPA